MDEISRATVEFTGRLINFGATSASLSSEAGAFDIRRRPGIWLKSATSRDGKDLLRIEV
jgi:hypothetical protein